MILSMCFFQRCKTFCGFSMSSNQYWVGRVYDLCVYFMTGTPECSTESGFMAKQTPGLQDIGLSPTPRRLHNAAKLFHHKIIDMYDGDQGIYIY